MGKNWCPGWESNPHEEKSPEDFKSSASAIPPPGHWHYKVNESKDLVQHRQLGYWPLKNSGVGGSVGWSLCRGVQPRAGLTRSAAFPFPYASCYLVAAAAASLSRDTRSKTSPSSPAGSKSISANTTQKAGENLPGHDAAIAQPITRQAANAAQNHTLKTVRGEITD